MAESTLRAGINQRTAIKHVAQQSQREQARADVSSALRKQAMEARANGIYVDDINLNGDPAAAQKALTQRMQARKPTTPAAEPKPSQAAPTTPAPAAPSPSRTAANIAAFGPLGAIMSAGEMTRPATPAPTPAPVGAPRNPMLEAITSHPFDSGVQLKPEDVRITGAGPQARVQSQSGERWVGVQPTGPMAIAARFDEPSRGMFGKPWGELNPAQRAQVLRSTPRSSTPVGTVTDRGTPANYRGESTDAGGRITYDPSQDRGMAKAVTPSGGRAVIIDPRYVTPGRSNIGYAGTPVAPPLATAKPGTAPVAPPLATSAPGSAPVAPPFTPANPTGPTVRPIGQGVPSPVGDTTPSRSAMMMTGKPTPPTGAASTFGALPAPTGPVTAPSKPAPVAPPLPGKTVAETLEERGAQQRGQEGLAFRSQAEKDIEDLKRRANTKPQTYADMLDRRGAIHDLGLYDEGEGPAAPTPITGYPNFSPISPMMMFR